MSGRRAGTDDVTIGERLRAVRTELDLNQTEMARAIGLTQASIAAYETNSRRPPLPVLLALEHTLRISHEWVLDGQGSSFVNAGPARPTIVTSPEELSSIDRLEGHDRYYAVPYLRDPAAAGDGLIMEEQVEGYCVIHERVAPHPESVRCVRVSGDSMAPTLTDGSIVAVDVTPIRLRNLEGRIVCSRTGDGTVVIKRLRVRDRFALLFSDSPDQHTFAPLVVDLREVADPIIGQIIWAWVDLR